MTASTAFDFTLRVGVLAVKDPFVIVVVAMFLYTEAVGDRDY